MNKKTESEIKSTPIFTSENISYVHLITSAPLGNDQIKSDRLSDRTYSFELFDTCIIATRIVGKNRTLIPISNVAAIVLKNNG